MKLSRILLWAAVGAGAYLLLTRTEKGRELKNIITDKAGKWRNKLGNMYQETAEDLNGLMEDGAAAAGRAKSRAKNLA